jgi:hypothetical protein
MAFERAKRAAADPRFAGKVLYREIDTFNNPEHKKAGISDALFISNKQVWTGPPPSYEKIHRLIEKQVKRLT